MGRTDSDRSPKSVLPVQERGSGFPWEKGRKIKEEFSSLVLDKVRLDLYFMDWLEIWPSGKRLGLYFIDWLEIRSLPKSSFISLYKQDVLFLTDFLECW